MKNFFISTILILVSYLSVFAQTTDTSSGKSEEVVNCWLPRISDEYGKLPRQDEMARLSNTALELNENPNFIALFIISLTKSESYSSVKKRVDNISNYLIQIEKISKERLKLVFRMMGLIELLFTLYRQTQLIVFQTK